MDSFRIDYLCIKRSLLKKRNKIRQQGKPARVRGGAFMRHYAA
jgi:hypothetical protein